MREIKFRGRKAELPRGWVYGYFILRDNGDLNCIIDADGKEHLVIAGTVGQFTGQKDTFDKEIFEGDIFGWEYFGGGSEVSGVGVVTWSDDDGGFDFGDDRRPSFCEREIVGNCTENPELLKQKKLETV